MFHLPIFGKKKLLLSFEYGLTIASVAKENNVEVTKELIVRAENIIMNEFKKKNPERLSVEMLINILASFETTQ